MVILLLDVGDVGYLGVEALGTKSWLIISEIKI